MTAEQPGEPEVLVSVAGSVGRLTLNRPKAINALNHGMVATMLRMLESWADDPGITAVVVDGAGSRGLCAGGDIVAVYRDRVGGGTATLDFWRTEYRLNAAIHRFPKPYVALMDGIVMGGGVGISAHGNTRVVTERSVLAMPETGIGFPPDVGGTYLLAQAPGEIGTHLALTAGRCDGADAIALGLADHFVPSASLPAFVAAILDRGVDAAVAEYARTAEPSGLLAERAWIDDCYRGDEAEQILHRLERSDVPAAHAAARELRGKSPSAVKATLRTMRNARGLATLEAALEMDFRIASHSFDTPDLVEGIRAQVIDKDRCPRWRPEQLAEVTHQHVAAYFAPLAVELGLAPTATV